MLDTATQTAQKIDPRVKRTHKLIVDAFVSLQAEKSFDDITIQDITDRATVNRATFYAHFPDKYALLDELIRGGFGRTLQERLGSCTDTTTEHLRQLFLAVTEHLSSIETRCRRSFQMFESLVETQIKAQLCVQVRTWLEAQPLARTQSGRRLDIAATVMSWSIYGAALEWRNQGGEQTAEAFADEALPLIAATVEALGK